MMGHPDFNAHIRAAMHEHGPIEGSISIRPLARDVMAFHDELTSNGMDEHQAHELTNEFIWASVHQLHHTCGADPDEE